MLMGSLSVSMQENASANNSPAADFAMIARLPQKSSLMTLTLPDSTMPTCVTESPADRI